MSAGAGFEVGYSPGVPYVPGMAGWLVLLVEPSGGVRYWLDGELPLAAVELADRPPVWATRAAAERALRFRIGSLPAAVRYGLRPVRTSEVRL